MSRFRLLARLVGASLWSRRLAVFFVVLAVAVSTVLFLSVERLRTGAWESFSSTVAGTDLIVGARSGRRAADALLGLPHRQRDQQHHGGIRARRGRDAERRLDRAAFAGRQPSRLPCGSAPTRTYFEALPLRAGPAARPSAKARRSRTCSTWCWARRWRRIWATSWATASWSRTGWAASASRSTTTCRSLCRASSRPPARRSTAPSTSRFRPSRRSTSTGRGARARAKRRPPTCFAKRAARGELEPEAVTALLVGTRSKLAIFGTARRINTYREEPLLAVLPGVALGELWSVVGTAERALAGISFVVVLTAIVGLVATILATLEQRRREIAILRSLGARPLACRGVAGR